MGVFAERPRSIGYLNSSEAPTFQVSGAHSSMLNRQEPPTNGFRGLPTQHRETEVPHMQNRFAMENHLPTWKYSHIPEELPLSDDEREEDKSLYTMVTKSEPPRPLLLATGLCYDSRMRYHSELDPPKQRMDFHPEDPRRIFHIYEALCHAGLLQDPQFRVPAIVDRPLVRIPARYAEAPEICLVHTAEHYANIAQTPGEFPKPRKLLINLQSLTKSTGQSDESLLMLERQFDSIYFNRLSFSCARLSAGGAIETCKAVVVQAVKNAIAVIRPPGHHAECNRPMGFCLFDNVSIATKVCQADYPDICRKVLILDWYVLSCILWIDWKTD